MHGYFNRIRFLVLSFSQDHSLDELLASEVVCNLHGGISNEQVTNCSTAYMLNMHVLARMHSISGLLESFT